MPVKRSNISWTDFSGGDLNFVIGCTPISEGCKNCYARSLIENRQGRDFSQVRVYPEKLERLKTAKFEQGDKPFRRGDGSKPMAFVCDLSDLFHKDVPDKTRFEFFEIVKMRQDIDWQVLTKRPVTMQSFFGTYYKTLPDNLWIGISVETESANKNRMPYLQWMKTTYQNITTYVSLEPLLQLVHIHSLVFKYVDWCIVGGESGNNKREFDKKWAKHIRYGCQQYGTAFFFKQGSHRYPGRDDLLDGVEYKEFPK